MTAKRRFPAVAALAAGLLASAVGVSPAQATTCVAGDNQFTGATSSDWNTATNWTRTDNAADHHVPCSGEDVKINVNNKSATLSTGSDGVANSITLGQFSDLF